MDAENGGREAIERYRVAPSLMRLALPVEFPASTESVEPLRDVAGQARAQEAIRFGLAIEAEGYNIAISGRPASGRSMIAKNLLGEVAAARPTPHDWVYLYNFTDPRRPKAAALPAGASAGLERGLATLARVCKEELPRAFDSEAYAKKAQETIEPFSRQREAVLQSLERAARQQGFLLNSTPMGIVPVAARPDGTPLTQEEFDALPPDQCEQLEQRGVQVQEAVGSALRQARHFEAQATDAVEAVDGEITRFILGPVLDDLRKQFATDGLAEHLAGLEVGDDRGAEAHRHRGGAQPGEAVAGGRALDLGLLHQPAVGLQASLAGDVALVERLAERAAVDVVLVQAPGGRVGRHQPQRQHAPYWYGIFSHTQQSASADHYRSGNDKPR